MSLRKAALHILQFLSKLIVKFTKLSGFFVSLLRFSQLVPL